MLPPAAGSIKVTVLELFTATLSCPTTHTVLCYRVTKQFNLTVKLKKAGLNAVLQDTDTW